LIDRNETETLKKGEDSTSFRCLQASFGKKLLLRDGGVVDSVPWIFKITAVGPSIEIGYEDIRVD